MTLQEYYGFPEGANVNFRYLNFYDMQEENFPYPSSVSSIYGGENRTAVKLKNTSNVTSMSYMFDECTNLRTVVLSDTSNVTNMSYMFNKCTYLTSIPPLDTSNVTNMSYMFAYCQNLGTIPEYDTSNVTSMNNMFYTCSNLASIPPLDTSNVTNMSRMFYNCASLRALPPMDCSKISSGSNYPLYYSSSGTFTLLTDIGGFINMKYSWTETYGLSKCPNLTYESCINILNGLYDFTGNGQTPTSSQGKLKVHANFLTAVGDEISIGTNKGWTITT